MDELLRNLGIEQTEDVETIVKELELKQSEIMERLDNVEDEKRRKKLEDDLNRITGMIMAFSVLRGKTQTGITREEDTDPGGPDDFSDLKNQTQEEKAVQVLTDKQEAKTEEELYDEALAVMATPDFAKGIEMMRSLAERGYAEAQFYLGVRYEKGEGVPQNYKKAMEWYQKAAEQGNAEAQFCLGVKYKKGKVVPKNYEKAIEWYEKAANQGHVTAQYNLGEMYENGHVVAKNYEKAAEWYHKAANQGYVTAQYNLGEMYENGRVVAKNYEKAAEWYQKAAEQGDAESQSNLGSMYEDGRGVPQSYEKAAEWYEKAADQGHVTAQNNLGLMYEDGRGVPQNYEKAAEWYEKAANQGNATAQNNLGLMYENGRGVPQDYKEAAKWYEKAANQRFADALYNLGVLFRDGRGVSKNYPTAVRLFRDAGDYGIVNALYNLGEMYQNGEGVSKNLNQAKEFYQRAANLGHESAQAKLGMMYEEGRGVPQSNEKAASRGDADAQLKILKDLAEDAERRKKREHQNKHKAEKRKIRKRLVKTLIIAAILALVINWFYLIYGKGYTGKVSAYIPNIAYTGNVRVGWTNSPYYISLVPLESLTIWDTNENLSIIINPFGAKSVHIENAMKKVKIHDKTETLYINCENLTELSIPDSVKTLTLTNLKDELASTLILPESLEQLMIQASPELTNTEILELLPESLQALKFYCSDGIKDLNINITKHLDALYVETGSEIQINSLTLSGDIDYVTVKGVVGSYSQINIESISKYIDMPYCGDKVVNGTVDMMSMMSGQDVVFNSVPRVLDLAIVDTDELALPEGIEMLTLFVGNDTTDIVIPSTVKRLELRRLGNLENIILPDGLMSLYINSSEEEFDFESMNIPENIKYWGCYTKNFNDRYISDDCPKELIAFSVSDYIHEESTAVYDNLMKW